MSLEERFNDAAEKIKKVPAGKTSNDEKLVRVQPVETDVSDSGVVATPYQLVVRARQLFPLLDGAKFLSLTSDLLTWAADYGLISSVGFRSDSVSNVETPGST